MQLQIADRATGRGRLRAAHHTRPAHAVSPRCAYSRRAVRHVRHAFVLRAAPAQVPMARQRPGKRTRVPRVDGASLLAPTHGMDMASLSPPLKPSHTAHYRHERIGGAGSGQPPQQLRRSWPAARTSRTGAAPFLPPSAPCPELLDAPRLTTASRAEPHARDRTEWGRGGHVLPLPLGA